MSNVLAIISKAVFEKIVPKTVGVGDVELKLTARLASTWASRDTTPSPNASRR